MAKLKHKNDRTQLVKQCCGRKTCIYKALSQDTIDLMDTVGVTVWSSACGGNMGIEFAPKNLEKLVNLARSMDSKS